MYFRAKTCFLDTMVSERRQFRAALLILVEKEKEEKKEIKKVPGYRCKLFISRIFFLDDMIGQCQMCQTPLGWSPSDLIARIFILPLPSDTEQCMAPVNAMDRSSCRVTTNRYQNNRKLSRKPQLSLMQFYEGTTYAFTRPTGCSDPSNHGVNYFACVTLLS